MSQPLAPFGETCALKSAVVGPKGTATACPSPTSWQRNEMGMVGNDARGYIQPAIFHNRGGTLNCWQRAVAAGIVQ